jgi:anti-sigma factor RsiW
MNQDQQLKLQAFLDGELPETEARSTANWIANDPEAAALHKELKNTRQALSGFEVGIKLPESREFYWSKIRREIERLERTEAPQEEKAKPSCLLRVLFPASAIAVVAITAMLAAKNFGLLGPGNVALVTPELETALADSGAFTYRDDKEGITMVWLSYDEYGLAYSEDATIIQ